MMNSVPQEPGGTVFRRIVSVGGRMEGGRASFEIQTLHDERWVTEEIHETERAARAAATAVFAKPKCRGVRIVRNWRRADGMITEQVVHTETRELEEGKVSISGVEEAAYCRQVPDYYRLESRATISRLFRKYIEQVVLTPTELIHSYKALKKLQEIDTLFPAAVDRVATIQSRMSGEDARVRREEVYRAVDQMTQKARRAEEYTGLPTLKDGDFEKMVSRLDGIAPRDETPFFALVVLSRDLAQQRSWLGKLERLAGMADPGLGADALILLDGVIADLLGVPTALQDLLGYRRNLGQALCALADLCEGRLAAEKSGARAQVEILNPLLAGGQLADSRKSLLERLQRQLASGQSLNRAEPAREHEAFREVATRLLGPNGFLGGPETAVALTRRYVFLLRSGGQTAMSQAVGGVVSALPDPLSRVRFLTELAGSSLGGTLSAEIAGNLRHLLQGKDMDGLVAREWPIKERLFYITRIYDNIAAATALAEVDRRRLLDILDDILVAFVGREGIIERLDNPSAPLRDRTTRLLEFCAARVLPPTSKAQQLARQRVITILRQPNFELHFIDGITEPRRAEDLLRGLHGLLARGGFK